MSEKKPPVRAVSLDALDGDSATAAALVPLYFHNGDSKTLRLVTREPAQVGLHFRDEEETGSRRPYQCLGDGCYTCAGGRRAVTTFLVPALYVPTLTLGALSFGEPNGPDSLRRQVVRHLRLPNYAQHIVELSKSPKGNKFTLKSLRVLTEQEDGEAYGLGVIREVLDKGGITPEDMAATIDQLTNDEMLEESPALRREIELRHPGLLDK